MAHAPSAVLASPARAPRSLQHRDPPFAHNFVGDLVHGREHTANAPRRRLVGHRAVGDREVRFFGEAVSLDLEQNVLDPGRRAAVEGGIDQRLQDMPDLAPTLADRLT